MFDNINFARPGFRSVAPVYSGLFEHNAASLNEWLLTFRKTVVPSSSRDKRSIEALAMDLLIFEN